MKKNWIYKLCLSVFIMCSITYEKLQNVHHGTTRYFEIVLLQYLFTNNLYKRCLAYVNQLTLCDSLVVCLVLFVIRTTFHSVLLVCLFFWSLSSHSIVFSLIWRCHHYRWRLQNLVYAQHSWPWNSKGTLECHTFVTRGIRV